MTLLERQGNSNKSLKNVDQRMMSCIVWMQVHLAVSYFKLYNPIIRQVSRE